jgi:hypothetical protein
MLDTLKSLVTSKRMGVLVVAALSYLGVHFGLTLSDADRAALEQGVPVLITTVGLIITKVIDSRKKTV